jgi:hypothetical protein
MHRVQILPILPQKQILKKDAPESGVVKLVETNVGIASVAGLPRIDKTKINIIAREAAQLFSAASHDNLKDFFVIST